MVATILRLRYRILGNTLTRSVGQLIGFLFGGLAALWVLGLVTAGLVAIAVFQGLDVAQTASVAGGSLLVLGWLVGPLLVTGMDTTVDAARLAQFPLSTRQIMRALTATGLTGIPGIVTALGALASIVLWVRWPAAAVVSVVCIVIGVLTCVVVSRLMGALARGLGGSRRGREIVGTLVLVVLVLSGPIVAGATALLGDAGDQFGARIAQIAAALGWTPLGAAWAVAGDIAAASWLTALAKLAIAVVTVGVVWLLWKRALEASASSPPRRVVRTARPDALGWFGRMPTGGAGATWARALTSWLRDPRYARQLLVVPLLPVVLALTTGVDGGAFAASALIVGFLLGVAGYTDVSYDGTGLASVIATGIRGRADRLGRMLGAASIGLPLTIGAALVTVGLSDRWESLPAVLGGALGLLLVGYGVCAVSSALLVMPVARPGDSPFKSVPGQTFLMGLTTFAVWGATVLIAAPALVLALIGLLGGSALLGWIALLIGLVFGVGMAVAGVVVGGRTFDGSAPTLLARIKAFPR